MRKRILSLFLILLLAIVPFFASCSLSDLIGVDYKTLVNTITTEVMPSNVIFKTTYHHYAQVWIYSGSGVIVYEEEQADPTVHVYYALTNNHVVNKTSLEDSHGHTYSPTSVSFEVDDYKGNVTENSDITLVKASANYDLALLRFTTSETLVVTPVSTADLSLDDAVFAIGQPLSQINALTIGNITGLNVAPPETNDDDSTIQFDVITHSAYINEGSSGGMLLNTKLQVCGINYAGTTGSRNFTAYSIPVSAIREFVDNIINI